jgi:DNA-binding FadR family transcriptional regulator
MSHLSRTSRASEIQRQRLGEQVAAKIAEDITSGSLGSGDSLPSERELVAQFGVSRTVIREATSRLSAKGLIHVVHGKGASVASSDNWKVIDVGLLDALEHSLVELLEVRRILEMEVVALAAERATDDDIQSMADAIERYDDALEDIERRVQADMDFHAAIVKACGNSLFPVILEPISELLRSSRQATLGAPMGRRKTQVAHRRILDAIKSRNQVLARQAMHQHLDEVQEDLLTVGIE